MFPTIHDPITHGGGGASKNAGSGLGWLGSAAGFAWSMTIGGVVDECRQGATLNCAAEGAMATPAGRVVKLFHFLRRGDNATDSGTAVNRTNQTDESPGSSAPCRNSFTEETLVLMAVGGHKKIKDVVVGDLVLAADPQTGITAPHRVLNHITSSGEKQLVRIDLKDGSTIVATGNHPFWAAFEKRWIAAEELNTGDHLTTYEGKAIEIVDILKTRRYEEVYNLTVEDMATFHVSPASVVVHNCPGSGYTPSGDAANYDRDELAQLARQHAGADNALKPTAEEIAIVLERGVVSTSQNSDNVELVYNGIRVFVNEKNAVRSTAYYIGGVS